MDIFPGLKCEPGMTWRFHIFLHNPQLCNKSMETSLPSKYMDENVFSGISVEKILVAAKGPKFLSELIWL